MYHEYMRKLFTIAQKFWVDLVIVVGVYFLASGVVGFYSSVGCTSDGRINPYRGTVTGCEGTVSYGYSDERQKQIAIGSSLIAIGILAKMRKKS